MVVDEFVERVELDHPEEVLRARKGSQALGMANECSSHYLADFVPEHLKVLDMHAGAVVDPRHDTGKVSGRMESEKVRT